MARKQCLAGALCQPCHSQPPSPRRCAKGHGVRWCLRHACPRSTTPDELRVGGRVVGGLRPVPVDLEGRQRIRVLLHVSRVVPAPRLVAPHSAGLDRPNALDCRLPRPPGPAKLAALFAETCANQVPGPCRCYPQGPFFEPQCAHRARRRTALSGAHSGPCAPPRSRGEGPRRHPEVRGRKHMGDPTAPAAALRATETPRPGPRKLPTGYSPPASASTSHASRPRRRPSQAPRAQAHPPLRPGA